MHRGGRSCNRSDNTTRLRNRLSRPIDACLAMISSSGGGSFGRFLRATLWVNLLVLTEDVENELFVRFEIRHQTTVRQAQATVDDRHGNRL